MAEETIENQGAEGLDSAEEPKETVDWEAKYKELQKVSRKWESRAKENKRAADELGKAQEKAKTIEERVALLEGENKSFREKAARVELVKSVSEHTGLPVEVVSLLNGGDEDALTEQAELLAERMKPKGGAPRADEAGRKQKPGKMTKEEILKIKNPRERKAAIAENIELFRKE